MYQGMRDPVFAPGDSCSSMMKRAMCRSGWKGEDFSTSALTLPVLRIDQSSEVLALEFLNKGNDSPVK